MIENTFLIFLVILLSLIYYNYRKQNLILKRYKEIDKEIKIAETRKESQRTALEKDIREFFYPITLDGILSQRIKKDSPEWKGGLKKCRELTIRCRELYPDEENPDYVDLFLLSTATAKEMTIEYQKIWLDVLQCDLPPINSPGFNILHTKIAATDSIHWIFRQRDIDADPEEQFRLQKILLERYRKED